MILKHHPVGRPDYQELVTVNGLVAPRFPIRPGEAQFWMMGNIGADRFQRVKIEAMLILPNRPRRIFPAAADPDG